MATAHAMPTGGVADPAERRAVTRELRVVSYNVHGCIGTDRRHDVARIAAVLQEIDADIVGLQEVHSCPTDGKAVDEIERLAHVTGLTAVPGPVRRAERGEYGIALLTRLPVVGVRRIDLSVPGREPRCALDCDLDLGREAARVITTHLGLSFFERRRQSQRLVDSIAREPERLVVVLGDINEWVPLARSLRRLGAHFGRAPAVSSWPSWRPFLSLDRIWIHPPSAVREVRAHTSTVARRASDHLPVVARLERELDVARATRARGTIARARP